MGTRDGANPNRLRDLGPTDWHGSKSGYLGVTVGVTQRGLGTLHA
jgi:hypothetical protein